MTDNKSLHDHTASLGDEGTPKSKRLPSLTERRQNGVGGDGTPRSLFDKISTIEDAEKAIEQLDWIFSDEVAGMRISRAEVLEILQRLKAGLREQMPIIVNEILDLVSHVYQGGRWGDDTEVGSKEEIEKLGIEKLRRVVG